MSKKKPALNRVISVYHPKFPQKLIKLHTKCDLVHSHLHNKIKVNLYRMFFVLRTFIVKNCTRDKLDIVLAYTKIFSLTSIINNSIRFPSVIKTPGVFMSVFKAPALSRRLVAKVASSRRFFTSCTADGQWMLILGLVNYGTTKCSKCRCPYHQGLVHFTATLLVGFRAEAWCMKETLLHSIVSHTRDF